MIGTIIGDIVGSRFEFKNHRSTEFELFHPDCTFTDDTICTIAVAEWLMCNCVDALPEIMREWCRNYPSSYGNMFRSWISGSIGAYNSYGNGSAMRVSPVAWAFDSLTEVLLSAQLSAEISHNHSEGIKGAQAVAEAIYMLRKGAEKKDVVDLVFKTYGYINPGTCDQIRPLNEFDETCQICVPQAFQCFLESTDFESSIRLAVSIGGDTDTIAAIVGSLAEAYYGIPAEIEAKAMTYLPIEMIRVLNKFRKHYHGR
jgi:ADP-ribosylglycohydrolase